MLQPLKSFTLKPDMKRIVLIVAGLAASGLFAKEMTFTAEHIAVDNVTKAAVATGKVEAVYTPYRLTSESLRREADGTIFFHDSTCATTCTNEVGHTHWNVSGSIEYKADDHVLIRNACLRFYEIPIMYLPYLWYPLNWQCGFQWMPGYTGRWGAFLLTRYSYNIAGDPSHADNTWWLKGSTNFDLRYKNGVALGENLNWNLGDFGDGSFRVYYAWDKDYERYKNVKHADWGSAVDEERYSMTLKHVWQVTERDVVRVRGSYVSDSHFVSDFMRRNFFDFRQNWQDFKNSGIWWEHLERSFAFGIETSGRLNDFYASTDRLPEFYLDVNPVALFDSALIYESQNRIGYLRRNYAENVTHRGSPFGSVPGLWADYETFRFDTYHRISAPFRTADDFIAVVPRVGYHGTFWNDSGMTDLVGKEHSVERDGMFRSIGEVGATFAARGTGWVNDACAHTIEPYVDVLFQKAWYSGRESDARAYVFDNIDTSLIWEDEFAGRGRNLPYTYYGLTPGVRNLWSFLEENGSLTRVVDFDVYSAFVFNQAEYEGVGVHKLPKPGTMPYGKNDVNVMPGARLKWEPSEDLALFSRAEYDADYNRLSAADLGFVQTVSRDLNYSVSYNLRDYRYWDFSSIPDNKKQTSGRMNMLNTHAITLRGEYQPLDWLAFGPFVRWDIRENELDAVGSWIDYLTDCLGFRLLVKYQSDYTRIDGYHHSDSWDVGFYIYLRAFGADSASVFGSH